MLEQMLASFLGTDHGRDAQQQLQQQGVPQSRIQQILSDALLAHSNGTPQPNTGLGGMIVPFIERFVREHLGGQPQTGVPRANNPAAQAKFDANLAGKGAMVGTTPEGQQKLDALRKAKAVEPQPFGKQEGIVAEKTTADYGKPGFGKSFVK